MLAAVSDRVYNSSRVVFNNDPEPGKDANYMMRKPSNMRTTMARQGGVRVVGAIVHMHERRTFCHTALSHQTESLRLRPQVEETDRDPEERGVHAHDSERY